MYILTWWSYGGLLFSCSNCGYSSLAESLHCVVTKEVDIYYQQSNNNNYV